MTEKAKSTARLFVAINFNTITRSRLIALRDDIRGSSRRGNFSRDENLHLTLVFLGECGDKQTTAAKSALDKVTFDPFEIVINRIGRFKRGGGDIWWAGAQENPALSSLQAELSEYLRESGFTLERRKYSPHITLGRDVVTDCVFDEIEPFGETVHIIDLMKSERIGGKLTYTSVYRRGKWITPIVIEPYNPQWAIEFEGLKTYLLTGTGGSAVDIHHVGSTSVEGLAAKPILDVDIEIADMTAFPEIADKLAELGYHHKGNYGIDGREAFKYDDSVFMSHHLYVCPSDSAELRWHLMFRDYLRANTAAVSEYGKLKRLLAAKCGNDIDAYIDGKSAFILGCLAKAFRA